MVQGDLFKDDVQLAIELLESKGYIITPPEEKIKVDCRRLIHFFYDRLNFYRNTKRYYCSNWPRDLKLVKNFTQSLFERGCPSTEVFEYAYKVIETMLKHEDKLSLKNRVTDLTILGQDKLRWVTDKAILMLEDEEDVGIEQLEERLEYMQDEFVKESIEKDPDDLERILRSIKDGEKETSS